MPALLDHQPANFYYNNQEVQDSPMKLAFHLYFVKDQLATHKIVSTDC